MHDKKHLISARHDVWENHWNVLQKELDTISLTVTQRCNIEMELYSLKALFDAANVLL